MMAGAGGYFRVLFQDGADTFEGPEMRICYRISCNSQDLF